MQFKLFNLYNVKLFYLALRNLCAIIKARLCVT